MLFCNIQIARQYKMSGNNAYFELISIILQRVITAPGYRAGGGWSCPQCPPVAVSTQSPRNCPPAQSSSCSSVWRVSQHQPTTHNYLFILLTMTLVLMVILGKHVLYTPQLSSHFDVKDGVKQCKTYNGQ